MSKFLLLLCLCAQFCFHYQIVIIKTYKLYILIPAFAPSSVIRASMNICGSVWKLARISPLQSVCSASGTQLQSLFLHIWPWGETQEIASTRIWFTLNLCCMTRHHLQDCHKIPFLIWGGCMDVGDADL